ncbi:MAG TPA: alpha/beta hydrolase [Polyangiales bacterium]|nr:alpha/beta hydrolase [Polyangiales bacterium]
MQSILILLLALVAILEAGPDVARAPEPATRPNTLLIVWGDLDEFLLVDNAHRLHERLPRSRLQVFERCGHFSYQDKPEEFAQMILDWVGGGYRGV